MTELAFVGGLIVGFSVGVAVVLLWLSWTQNRERGK